MWKDIIPAMINNWSFVDFLFNYIIFDFLFRRNYFCKNNGYFCASLYLYYNLYQQVIVPKVLSNNLYTILFIHYITNTISSAIKVVEKVSYKK